ncbi:MULTISPECIES: DNA methylase [Pseudomonas]|uniref:DNA methylase n=1 Tax=Pseudomonas TaxID=286 RepID=UPI001BEA629C|nr:MULTISPECIES: DNA methylase [Pseudomonas]MBT2339877.1 DNA methylase [Pseudomonas fluorescens]MCD4530392.1 DNA methylase [Pseudomonas sp. C3-2018]
MIPLGATDLGIDIANQQRHGLYKWLLASFLLGKRIRASVALQAYKVLVDQHGLDTPGKLSQCAHRELVRLLGQAGYARYDESTARRLRTLGARVEQELPSRLEAIRGGVEGIPDVEQWLLTFEGIGPKTLEIFMREARAILESIAASPS